MIEAFGVLRGRIDRWVREDGESTPHLQVRVVDDRDRGWRIAVNVESSDGSQVVYWLVDPLPQHPLLSGLGGLAGGFTATTRTARDSLDLVKAPFFDFATGRALPPSGAAQADDLQDLLALHLQQCRDAGGEVFAFGSRFTRDLGKPIDREFGNTDGLHGVHNIHLNQGNTGRFAGDNGAFQDGALILAYPDRFAGLFLAFQTQRVPTTDVGAPAPNSRLIGELISGAGPVGTPPPVGSVVYLERALLNPAGPDAGKEAVVLGNLANAAVSLDGWTIVDRNGRVTALAGQVLPPGGSAVLALDGTGAQLGNGGGNLLLRDPAGAQADAVVYTGADADVTDRFVRFGR